MNVTNTADVTGGKAIAISSHPNSDVIAVNPLVAFYDIYERELPFLCSIPDTTRDLHQVNNKRTEKEIWLIKK
jgi:hypothetical protein